MSNYKKRYEGARWRIVYGAYDGVEKFAIDELQRAIQRRVPYVVEVLPASSAPVPEGSHLAVVGTAAENALLADLGKRGAISLPSQPEGYALKVLASPWDSTMRVAAIAGADPAGVLYGVEDFIARVLVSLGGDTAAGIRKALDNVADFSVTEAPALHTRGIWTWGYVIYDYKRFFDNMARLRMNSITIWNDCPPLNSADLISYARSRGVGVIAGFHWGWGTGLNLAKKEGREAVKKEVLAKYRNEYSHLDIDGIYFQTETEHSDTQMEGRSTASWACELVNDVSAALLKMNPALRVYFGLHATSVHENYTDLAPLDPRVVVVWEDAGAIPFSYEPIEVLATATDGKSSPTASTPEETIAYAKRLASLRPGGEFALVPKGWTSLSWPEEFEHHSSFILGERTPDYIRTRLAQRQPRWDYINTLWLRNYPLAARFYREMLETVGSIAAWGLIEDGILEEAIQPSVALFAQTMWNPKRSDDEILRSAMSPYYQQA